VHEHIVPGGLDRTLAEEVHERRLDERLNATERPLQAILRVPPVRVFYGLMVQIEVRRPMTNLRGAAHEVTSAARRMRSA